jgi:hypothetical protein
VFLSPAVQRQQKLYFKPIFSLLMQKPHTGFSCQQESLIDAMEFFLTNSQLCSLMGSQTDDTNVKLDAALSNLCCRVSFDFDTYQMAAIKP